MSEHVRIEVENGILTLTLQRPDKKNALTSAMYQVLSDAMERAETDPSIRSSCSRATATVLPPATTLPISPPSPEATATRKLPHSASSRAWARHPSR
jgi:hypothetical protein